MEGRFLDNFSSIFELDLPKNLQSMSEFIEYIVPKVQPWSEDLRETQFWVGKRWCEIHDNDAWDRSFIHIFMPDGEHMISQNGIIRRTVWRILPESNAMILDEGNSILYDLVFLNGQMIILRQNGTSRYFVLGEEGFVRKKVKHDWRAAMEELFNIYRNNSKFSLYVLVLVVFVVLFIVLTLT